MAKKDEVELEITDKWQVVEALEIDATVQKLAFSAITAKDGATVVDVRWEKDGEPKAVRLVRQLEEPRFYQSPTRNDIRAFRETLAKGETVDLIAVMLARRLHARMPMRPADWRRGLEMAAVQLAQQAKGDEPLAAE